MRAFILLGSAALLTALLTWALRDSVKDAPPAAVRARIVPTTELPASSVKRNGPSTTQPQPDPARIAYRLSQIGLECEPVLDLYAKLGFQDPQRFEACARYLNEPLPDWRYWQAKALEGRDLLARLQVEGETWLTQHNNWDELSETMEEASHSSDPEVQFALAHLWLNPEIAAGDGVAMLERACAALDCSNQQLEAYRDNNPK